MGSILWRSRFSAGFFSDALVSTLRSIAYRVLTTSVFFWRGLRGGLSFTIHLIDVDRAISTISRPVEPNDRSQDCIGRCDGQGLIPIRSPARASRRTSCGGTPNPRMNASRICRRSRNPVSFAITSSECRLFSIISRAASSRSPSIAFAGDCPVSSVNTRLNCRGLKCAVLASSSTGKRPVQVLARVVQRVLNAVGLRREIEHFRMLRLPARAPLMHHELVRDRTRDIGAEIFLDHPEREVETRGHARRVQIGPSTI